MTRATLNTILFGMILSKLNSLRVFESVWFTNTESTDTHALQFYGWMDLHALPSPDILQDTTVFYRKKVVNSHLISVAEVTEVLSLGPPVGITVTACLLHGARYWTRTYQITFAMQMESYVQPLLSQWSLMYTHTVTKNHIAQKWYIRIAARGRNWYDVHKIMHANQTTR